MLRLVAGLGALSKAVQPNVNGREEWAGTTLAYSSRESRIELSEVISRGEDKKNAYRNL